MRECGRPGAGTVNQRIPIPGLAVRECSPGYERTPGVEVRTWGVKLLLGDRGRGLDVRAQRGITIQTVRALVEELELPLRADIAGDEVRDEAVFIIRPLRAEDVILHSVSPMSAPEPTPVGRM